MQARAASERPESKVEIHRAQLWQRWRARWHVFRCGRALIPSLSFRAAVKPSAISTTVRARFQTFRHRLQTARLLAGRAPMSPQPPGLPRGLSCTTCQTKKPRNKSGLSSFIVDTKIESVGEPDIRHALHHCRHHRLFQVRRLCECHHPLETLGLKHNRYIVRVICPAVNT